VTADIDDDRVRTESVDELEHIHLRKVGAVLTLKCQRAPFDYKTQRPLVYISVAQVDEGHRATVTRS
jgi:hypothetical protein